MIVNEGLFSGTLGRAGTPQGSPFMATPLTRDLTGVGYDTGLYLEEGEKVLACSLNGQLVLVSSEVNGEDVFYVFALQFNPATGRLLFPGRNNDWAGWYRDFVTLGRPIKDEPVARGIDWILTKMMFITVSEAGITRVYVNSNLSTRYSGVYHVLCTPHRNRSFAKGIPGGDYDPFTGTPSDGTLIWDEWELPCGVIHRITGRDGESFCDWPQMVARFGENTLIDGFVLETLSDTSHYDEDSDSMTAYSAMYNGIRPVTPLEFYADGTEGRPVYAPNVRAAAIGGKLYARGMLTMGEACLIPAAFGEAGYPTEYFLYIANSHGFRSPYAPFENTVLERDEVWENTAPMLLKDINDPEQNFLAGYSTQKGHPVYGSICRLPNTGGVLFPDGSRAGEFQEVFYDPASRTALMLDEKGAFFFCGDVANGTIAALDDYRCTTLADWLAPARQVESLSPSHVAGSFREGMVLTEIDRYFARYALWNRAVGLTWGVFEKKQDEEDPELVTGRVRLSLGVERRQYATPGGGTETVRAIVATELGVPDDVDSKPLENIPVGDVIKNPFRMVVLDYNYNSQWQEVLPGCVLRRYNTDTGAPIYGMIDPETGDITESSSPGNLPDGWGTDGVFGFKPNGVVYPFPSAGDEKFFSSEPQTSRKWALGAASNGMIALVESSSGTRVAWRHTAFGNVVPVGSRDYYNEGLVEMVRPWTGDGRDIVEANRLNVILNNAPLDAQFSTMEHIGSAPVTDWQEDKKFLKTLTVWLVRAYYTPEGGTTPVHLDGVRMTNYLCIMRTDLDRSVFDFDEEMRKVAENG